MESDTFACHWFFLVRPTKIEVEFSVNCYHNFLEFLLTHAMSFHLCLASSNIQQYTTVDAMAYKRYSDSYAMNAGWAHSKRCVYLCINSNLFYKILKMILRRPTPHCRRHGDDKRTRENLELILRRSDFSNVVKTKLAEKVENVTPP